MRLTRPQLEIRKKNQGLNLLTWHRCVARAAAARTMAGRFTLAGLARRSPACRFTELDHYEVFLEVRRKNAALVPLPEFAAQLEAAYAAEEAGRYAPFAPQREVLAARLAAIAAARNDTGAAPP